VDLAARDEGVDVLGVLEPLDAAVVVLAGEDPDARERTGVVEALAIAVEPPVPRDPVLVASP
jgi:hypothetical protein